MTTLHRIDVEHRLYYLDCGAGYTALGWDFAHNRAKDVALWLGMAGLVPDAPLGTAEHYSQYRAAMSTGERHSARTGERCPTELVPELIGLEGQRAEVTFRDGTKRRCRIGRSTGWFPCHLAMTGRAMHGDPIRSADVVSARKI